MSRLFTLLVLMPALVISSHAVAGSDAPDASGDDAIVASRGVASITMHDIDTLMMQLDPKVRPGFLDSPERIERTLNGMLLSRQVTAEAEKNGLQNTEEYQDRIAMARYNILMQMQIDAYMKSLEEPDFVPIAKEKYLVDDGTLYGEPDRRDLSYILVSDKTRDDAAAKKLINEIRDRILAGETFESQARIYSDDKPSRRSNNLLDDNLSWQLTDVVKGATDPEFEKALWALKKVGDISPVVKSSFGYHVIRLDAIKPAEKHPFESVKGIIIKPMREKWREERKLQYITQFNAQKLEANPDLVASLRTRYETGEPQAASE